MRCRAVQCSAGKETRKRRKGDGRENGNNSFFLPTAAFRYSERERGQENDPRKQQGRERHRFQFHPICGACQSGVTIANTEEAVSDYGGFNYNSGRSNLISQHFAHTKAVGTLTNGVRVQVSCMRPRFGDDKVVSNKVRT